MGQAGDDPARSAVPAGIAAGLVCSVAYPLVVSEALPYFLTVLMAASFGPAFAIASLGLRAFLGMRRRSLAADLGLLSNAGAGVLFTAMLFVQMAVTKDPAWRTSSGDLVSIWLGLDVAWDVYLALGTAFFASAMLRDPRLGAAVGAAGLIIALGLAVLNLGTFPTPPAGAGAVDLGPLAGLWYLVVVILMWRDYRRGRAHPS